MSQHSDLLTLEITRAIHDRSSPEDLQINFIALLNTLEYDDSFLDPDTVVKHLAGHAKWMAEQPEGLYGVSRQQLLTCAHMVHAMGAMY